MVASLIPAVAGYAAGKFTRSAIDRGTSSILNRVFRKRSDAQPRHMTNSGIATRQHDFTVTKRKRRLSKRAVKRAKRARRWKRAVLKAVYDSQNPHFINFNQGGTIASGPGFQEIGHIGALYSFAGSASLCDLRNIYQSVKPYLQVTNSAGSGIAVTDNSSSKLIFNSAFMQVDMKNIGQNDCIVDVYEYSCRKDSNPSDIYAALDNSGIFWPGRATNVAMDKTTLGYSPYHSPAFTSCYKILGKVTYQLQVGGQASFKMSLPRTKSIENRLISGVAASSQAGLTGWTRGYIAVVRGVLDGTGFPTGASIAFNAGRTYSVSLPANLYPETGTKVTGVV